MIQPPPDHGAIVPVSMPRVALIAAMVRNGVIGRDNRMPWHLPADLRRFKAVTIGHPVVMGRKTYESIGRALPGRSNIVVTRTPGFAAPGCVLAPSLEAALAAARPAADVFVIGGGELYAQALPLATRLHLTEIDAVIEGDAYFPAIDPAQWRETAREPHAPAGAGEPGYAFVTLERVRS